VSAGNNLAQTLVAGASGAGRVGKVFSPGPDLVDPLVDLLLTERIRPILFHQAFIHFDPVIAFFPDELNQVSLVIDQWSSSTICHFFVRWRAKCPPKFRARGYLIRRQSEEPQPAPVPGFPEDLNDRIQPTNTGRSPTQRLSHSSTE
jgi:hypothetical protein